MAVPPEEISVDAPVGESGGIAASASVPESAATKPHAFQMWPQTPLVMMAFGLLLLILAAIGSTHGAAFEAGDAPAKFPMTSKYITYAFAGVLVLAGFLLLVIRRYKDDKTTWKTVLEEALGSWSVIFDTKGAFMTNLAESGLWVLLVIATIFAMIFITSIVSPTDPLAWVGYAIIVTLFLMIIITSPLLKLKFKKTAELALSYLTKPRILGFLVIAAGVFGVLAASAAYPMVSYAVYAIVIGLILYFGRDFLSGGFDFVSKLFSKRKGGTGEAETTEEESVKKGSASGANEQDRTWFQTLIRLMRNWLSDTLGWMTMDPEDYLDYEKALSEDALSVDARRSQILKDYGFAAATVATSGLIVALAFLLPFVYRRLPSLHIKPSLGYKYFTTPKPLSTVESMPLSKVLTQDRATSEYTISWWQFINSRKANANALPMIDLGSVGQVFLGPQIAQQTIALQSPLSEQQSTRITYDIVLQKWQNIAIRASGNRTDVFVDGKLAATSNQPPPAIKKNMNLGLPGLPIQQTMGGIAGFAVSDKAEPYLGILWNSLTDSPKKS
jgi:hypothetical protein